MTSGGNNFNYFLESQQTKISACSLNNKRNQGRWNKLKSGGKVICERSKQKNYWTAVRRIVAL